MKHNFKITTNKYFNKRNCGKKIKKLLLGMCDNKKGSLLLSKDKINTYICLLSSMFVFAMAFIINVILTNYSNVNDYGQYKYATNFILTVPSILGLGINWSCGSLVAKKDLSNNKNIIGASILVTIFLSLAITVLLYGILPISIKYGFNTFSNVKLTFPFVVIFMLQVLINQIYQGTGEIVKLSIFNVLPNLLIIIGFWITIKQHGRIPYSNAIYLYVISYSLVILPKLVGTHIKFNNLRLSLRELLKDIKTSGIKVYFSSIVTTSASQIIGLICGFLYGYNEYGYYSLALSMSFAFKLISTSTATAKFRDNAFKKRIPKSDFNFMILLDVIVFIIFLLLINKVFYIFFPKNYAPTVKYLLILALMNMLYGISEYINRFFILKDAGNIIMKNSMITSVVNIILSVVMIKMMRMTGLVLANVLTSIVNLTLYLYEYDKLIKKLDKNEKSC